MFGRRRHAATTAPAPTPQLTEERIFDIVHEQLAHAIGENGEWALTRRVDSDTDTLFHGVIAHSVASTVTEALQSARRELTERAEQSQAVPGNAGSGGHVAPNDLDDVAGPTEEPAAFRWEPAPITRWADLKRPVTGSVAHVYDDELVA